MKLKVLRKHLKSDYTIGEMHIDYEDGRGWQFFCHTLEDKVRDLNKDGDLNDEGEGKVYGETAIPYGKYKMIVNQSPKFGLSPLILDVPHFEYIRIHAGNTNVDTHGCLLLGVNNKRGMVTDSKETFKKFMEQLRISNQKWWEINIE